MITRSANAKTKRAFDLDNDPDGRGRDDVEYWLPWIFLGALTGLFLHFDYLTAHSFRDYPDAKFMFDMGIYIAQLNLLAAWAVLGSGSDLIRLPLTMLLLAAMWLASVAGIKHSGGTPNSAAVLVLGVLILFGALFTQIPLWVALIRYDWRLFSWRANLDAKVQGKYQFQLRHIVVATLLISIILGITRELLMDMNWYGVDWYFETTAILAAVAVTNLLIAVPCIWGAFLPWKSFAIAGVVWVIVCFGVSFIEVGALYGVLGPPGDEPILWHFTVLNLSQATTVVLPLLFLRAMGFRLRRSFLRETNSFGESP